MNTEITKDALTQLIRRLYTRDSGSDLQLSAEMCADIKNALESCLADRQLLKLYMSALESVLGGHAKHNGAFEVDGLENLGQSGLGGLDEGTLVCLALDPASLWCLHDIIVEDAPRCWSHLTNAEPAPTHGRAASPELAQDCHEGQSGIPWAELDCLSEPGFSDLLMQLDRSIGSNEGWNASLMDSRPPAEPVAARPILRCRVRWGETSRALSVPFESLYAQALSDEEKDAAMQATINLADAMDHPPYLRVTRCSDDDGAYYSLEASFSERRDIEICVDPHIGQAIVLKPDDPNKTIGPLRGGSDLVLDIRIGDSA